MAGGLIRYLLAHPHCQNCMSCMELFKNWQQHNFQKKSIWTWNEFSVSNICTWGMKSWGKNNLCGINYRKQWQKLWEKSNTTPLQKSSLLHIPSGREGLEPLISGACTGEARKPASSQPPETFPGVDNLKSNKGLRITPLPVLIHTQSANCGEMRGCCVSRSVYQFQKDLREEKDGRHEEVSCRECMLKGSDTQSEFFFFFPQKTLKRSRVICYM